MKEQTENSDPHDLDDVEEMLCPHCLKPVDPLSHFCNACGGPSSAFSAIDPMGQVYTAGHAYRQATERPTNIVIVLGIWLIFATPLLMVLFVILLSVRSTALPDAPVGNTINTISEPNTGGSLIALPLSLGLAIIYYLIVYKTTRAYIRTCRQAQAACNGCDEPIHDNFHACWHCGTPHEDNLHPEPQPTADPLAPRTTPEQCEDMPQSLASQDCPECGAPINEHAQDKPHDLLPAEHSREDRVRKTCLYIWLASWISLPVVTSILRSFIPYGETGGNLIHTSMFGVLIIAVISPMAFFYRLLPDTPSSS